MQPHKIVSQTEWIAARKAHLAAEKEFTKARDELARRRRELPWVKVDKKYVFDGPDGKVTLGDLFADKSQLIVYHFMLGPGWEEGCKSCSYLSDHWDPAIVHLAQRDVSFAVISRAGYGEIAAFKKRMGWRFNWVSSYGNDFNFDYGVSFTESERQKGVVEYNYAQQEYPNDEMPGLSVFAKNDSGEIFHTYSAYARGLDILVGTYNLLDLVPKGRDEEGLPHTMAWVRHHDRYDEQPKNAAACCG